MPIAFAPSDKEQELGITVGGKITLVSSSGGSVIVVVKEGRLCLDRTLASRIMVA